MAMIKFYCTVGRFLLIPCLLTLSPIVLRGQVIIRSFAGVTLANVETLGTGGTPPDTMGAAGTNQFAEFINGAFAVYSKNGVLQQSLITDNTFWENAGIS